MKHKMTFSLHQGGVVMSSRITRTQSSNIHPLAHLLDTCALIFSLMNPFYSLSQPHHVTASHLSPGDNRRSMGGWSERTQGQQNGRQKLIRLYICTRALHSFLSFAHCRVAPTVIPLLPKATFTPSIHLTSVYLVPVLHLLPPLTPFWPYGTHPFFPHARIIS